MTELPQFARRDGQRRRGIAAVEMAVVTPLIVTMLLGLFEAGRAVEVRQLLSNAAREAGRQAATIQMTNAEAAQVAKDYLKYAGLPNITNVVVTVENLTHPGTDAKSAAQLDRLQVTVTIPYSDVRLLNAKLLIAPTAKLTAKVSWYSLNDKPYPSPPEPPIE